MIARIPARLCLIFLLLCSTNVKSDDNWKCFSDLVSYFAHSEGIVEMVKHHNATLPDAFYLDSMWPYLAQNDPIVLARTQHKASALMQKWIQGISIQGEGLLIGIDGGLVAATEKTSDYWQGDETQFTQAIILPRGEIFTQKEVIDESTNLMLVKLSSPIYDGEQVEGVLVIGLDQFVIDYLEVCNDSH